MLSEFEHARLMSGRGHKAIGRTAQSLSCEKISGQGLGFRGLGFRGLGFRGLGFRGLRVLGFRFRAKRWGTKAWGVTQRVLSIFMRDTYPNHSSGSYYGNPTFYLLCGYLGRLGLGTVDFILVLQG